MESQTISDATPCEDLGGQAGFLLFDGNTERLRIFDLKEKSWKPEDQREINEEMSRLTALTIGEYLYVLMWDKSTKRLKIDDEKAKWEDLKESYYEHGVCPPAAVMEGSIYVVGGSYVREVNSAEKYDLSKSNWKTLPKKNLATRDGAVTSSSGFLYSIGGISSRRYLKEVERYDPISRTWSFVSPMTHARRAPATIEFKGKVFVMGGFADEYAGKLSSVECFDESTNMWTLVERMLKPRAQFSAFVLNDLIYTLGGDKGDDSIERFNPLRERDEEAINEWKHIELKENDKKIKVHWAVLIKVPITVEESE